MSKISGIYKIQSKVKPERIYIGSSGDISNRWKGHLGRLRRGNHHSLKLQRHYLKYGESDLLFSSILACDKSDLIKIEQYFIDSYNPYFNNSPLAGSTKGIKHTQESCANMSKAHKGNIPWNKGKKGAQKISDETKRKMSLSHKGNKSALGNKFSREACERLSEARKGRIFSEEHKKKIGAANVYRIWTNESRKKISESRKNESAEVRLKRSIAQKGKKLSPESIRKRTETFKKNRLLKLELLTN